MSQRSQKQMFFHSLPSEWKLPLNLAIGLHLFVLLAALFLPQLLQQRPIIPEITTIDLVSMADPSASKEPAAPPAAKPAPKQAQKPAPKEEAEPPAPTPPSAPPKPAEIIKPEVIKQIPPIVEKPVPIAEPVIKTEPVAPPVPTEAISLKPLKQKVKKEIKELPDKKVEETKVRKEELKNIAQQLQEEAKKEAAAQETIKQQRQMAAAREQARRADLEARLAMAEAERAAAEARSALRDQLRATSSRNAAAAGANTASTQTMGVLEQQYYATIMGHIKQYWQPPDVKSWDPDLLATVSITVAANGQIVSQSFEKESGDKLFDQFVLKTLEASNPLPVPPPALQKQRLEIGLRFKPSGIQ